MNTGSAPVQNVFFRYGTRVLYVATGIMCCVLGLVGAIGFSVICVFAGILLIVTGIFILVIEMPFCCPFISQVAIIESCLNKMGPLPIAIICPILGIISLVMCPSISIGFALLFLFASAAMRFREFIILRRSRSEVAGGFHGGSNPQNPSQQGYSGIENAFPPAAPAYGTDSLMDRMAVGAFQGGVQAATQKPIY